MYGAILGDIIGSPFEFDRGNKTKDFELFTRGCSEMTFEVCKNMEDYGLWKEQSE